MAQLIRKETISNNDFQNLNELAYSTNKVIHQQISTCLMRFLITLKKLNFTFTLRWFLIFSSLFIMKSLLNLSCAWSAFALHACLGKTLNSLVFRAFFVLVFRVFLKAKDHAVSAYFVMGSNFHLFQPNKVHKIQ